jgi:hypothetical protein
VEVTQTPSKVAKELSEAPLSNLLSQVLATSSTSRITIISTITTTTIINSRKEQTLVLPKLLVDLLLVVAVTTKSLIKITLKNQTKTLNSSVTKKKQLKLERQNNNILNSSSQRDNCKHSPMITKRTKNLSL